MTTTPHPPVSSWQKMDDPYRRDDDQQGLATYLIQRYWLTDKAHQALGTTPPKQAQPLTLREYYAKWGN